MRHWLVSWLWRLVGWLTPPTVSRATYVAVQREHRMCVDPLPRGDVLARIRWLPDHTLVEAEQDPGVIFNTHVLAVVIGSGVHHSMGEQ